MMPIDNNVMGIFPYDADEFFALDVMQGACESCDVGFARLLRSTCYSNPEFLGTSFPVKQGEVCRLARSETYLGEK
jgi:hypothetical protein